MPTSRPRHTITESDDVTRALADAARRWPEDRDHRTKLLLHLLAEGHRSIAHRGDSEAADRREAVQQTKGALTGCYPAGYLKRLRDDWPT